MWRDRTSAFTELSGNIATASVPRVIAFIMATDSQAMVGNDFMAGRIGSSPNTAVKKRFSMAGGSREVMTIGKCNMPLYEAMIGEPRGPIEAFTSLSDSISVV